VLRLSVRNPQCYFRFRCSAVDVRVRTHIIWRERCAFVVEIDLISDICQVQVSHNKLVIVSVISTSTLFRAFGTPSTLHCLRQYLPNQLALHLLQVMSSNATQVFCIPTDYFTQSFPQSTFESDQFFITVLFLPFQ